ncbi:MAG: HEAT repeat domain-containing protein [Chthoniobacterales bacterium]|nr:HEAT repeat domain-containing protein [Chthoniobacterales bacterium]
MRWFVSIASAVVFAGSAAFASDAAKLVQRLKAVAKPDVGITKKEREVAEQLQALGAKAVPLLLPLLADKNTAIRELASYTLRDIDGLTEEHLDALIDSARHGDGWIPPAIARVGTPRAVAFLVEELVRTRETENQLTWAIEMLGKKAVPLLLEVFRSEDGWDDALERTMYEVFRSLGAKAADAVDPLVTLACDEAAPDPMRARAILTLGAIGSAAQRTAPRLSKLQDSTSPVIREANWSALIDTHSAEAVPILTTWLQNPPDRDAAKYHMRTIGTLGSQGIDAGSLVVRYLHDLDWDMRVEAAHTLGRIGYKNAPNELVECLARADDWRLVFRAAEALGRLKIKEAIPSLTDISTAHWYLPVREAALRAISAINGEAVPEQNEPSKADTDDPFYLESVGQNLDSLDEKEVARLPLSAMRVADRAVRVRTQGEDGLAHVEKLRGIPVDGGHLVAADRGEWGGYIGFVGADQNLHVLTEENTQSIYKTGDGTLAVTGLAHLSFNSGFVYQIRQAAADSGSPRNGAHCPALLVPHDC